MNVQRRMSSDAVSAKGKHTVLDMKPRALPSKIRPITKAAGGSPTVWSITPRAYAIEATKRLPLRPTSLDVRRRYSYSTQELTLFSNQWVEQASDDSSDDKKRREDASSIRCQIHRVSTIITHSVATYEVFRSKHTIQVSRVIPDSSCYIYTSVTSTR